MNLNDYQSLARRTSSFAAITDPSPGDVRENILMATLGLNGEAGEVADHIKKMFYHLHKPDMNKLSEEIGDVLWYLSELCSALNLSLDEVAAGNIAKLKLRYGDAFSSEASINRQQ